MPRLFRHGIMPYTGFGSSTRGVIGNLGQLCQRQRQIQTVQVPDVGYCLIEVAVLICSSHTSNTLRNNSGCLLFQPFTCIHTSHCLQNSDTFKSQMSYQRGSSWFTHRRKRSTIRSVAARRAPITSKAVVRQQKLQCSACSADGSSPVQGCLGCLGGDYACAVLQYRRVSQSCLGFLPEPLIKSRAFQLEFNQAILPTSQQLWCVFQDRCEPIHT
ncbi:hypothetical protein B0T24DRAFT_36142 [Lasiosphaeria ovina]|uniref:Uncharacterized protein n=1 Tax=Lasiosphaeria ovina TaxID=92902 RepID=A0AAE0TXJ4_9PEZI|nr:hypothetical protein B0T24DRAFT_36142 [Lasiosphaeria ovina]